MVKAKTIFRKVERTRYGHRRSRWHLFYRYGEHHPVVIAYCNFSALRGMSAPTSRERVFQDEICRHCLAVEADKRRNFVLQTKMFGSGRCNIA